jgi:hypothetical protein
MTFAFHLISTDHDGDRSALIRSRIDDVVHSLFQRSVSPSDRASSATSNARPRPVPRFLSGVQGFGAANIKALWSAVQLTINEK